jgi:hypothetical protein
LIAMPFEPANRICCPGCCKPDEESAMPLRIMLETKDGRHVTSADIPINGDEDDWPEVVMFEGRPFMLDAKSGGLVTYTEAATLTLPPSKTVT